VRQALEKEIGDLLALGIGQMVEDLLPVHRRECE
jgi:hypothetical protein